MFILHSCCHSPKETHSPEALTHTAANSYQRAAHQEKNYMKNKDKYVDDATELHKQVLNLHKEYVDQKLLFFRLVNPNPETKLNHIVLYNLISLRWGLNKVKAVSCG